MLQRTLCGLLVAAVLTPSAFGQPPGDSPDSADSPQPVLTGPDGRTLDRQALLAAVRERNRNLAAARAAVEAARERIDEARGLPDLMAAYRLTPESALADDVRFGHVIEVGQEFPWPGTLARRGERAAALADVAGADLETLGHELALIASELYDDYRYVERALAINAEHLELLRAFQEVATARYAAGVAPQQAPLAAEVETAHVEHRQVVLTADRQTVVARLNALLHRPATAELPPPPAETETAALAAPPAAERGPDAAALIQMALEERPEMAAARSTVAARQTSVELARLSGRPDFRPMTSFNTLWGTQEHRWMVGLGLSLPVWRQRVRAGIAAAEAELDATDQRLVALADRIGAEVKTAVDRFEESRHVVALFTNRLLPAARDQIAAAQSGFETGQVTFLPVIDAERNLRDIELGLALAQAQYQQRLAELQRAVGLAPGSAWPTTASRRSPAPHAGASAPASNLPGADRPGRTP